MVEIDNIETYSAHDDIKSELFIRKLTNKIYKYMTSLSNIISINFPKYWNNITILLIHILIWSPLLLNLINILILLMHQI